MSQPVQRIEISTGSIVRIFAVLLGLYFIWSILDVLALLFVSIILVAALAPSIEKMAEQGIPRPAGVLMIYVLLTIVLGFLISLIIPPLVEQLSILAVQFPHLVQTVAPLQQVLSETNVDKLITTVTTELSGFTQGVFATAAKVFGGAVSALTVLALTFYLLVDAKKARESLIVLLPADYAKPVTNLIDRVGEKLGSWMRGQAVLCMSIAVVSYIGYLILGVPFALTLAVLAGLLEIVPVIGPILAGLIAVVVAYTSGSWQLAVGVFVLSVVIQQLENQVLVPKIMERAVGLSPIVVIVALAIGSKLGGTTGAILAIPVAAVVSVLVQEWPKLRRTA